MDETSISTTTKLITVRVTSVGTTLDNTIGKIHSFEYYVKKSFSSNEKMKKKHFIDLHLFNIHENVYFILN